MVPPAGLQNAKISVWWDIENCPVPRHSDPFQIAQSMSSMLRHASLTGAVTIDAFGDIKLLDRKVLEALPSTGINVNHVPNGNKDAADKAILVAMLFWALDNAPPANLVLISGDGDFANALHRLRLKGYNVLLVRPDQPIKSALLGAASSVWHWTSVVKGHNYGVGSPEVPSQQDWVSVNDMQYEFSSDVWIDFGHFLLSEENRQSIINAHSRYAAACILKNSGPARIQNLLIEQIILLLNQSIQRKKWLRICGGKGRTSVAINLQCVMSFEGLITKKEDHLAHVPCKEQPGLTGPLRVAGNLAAIKGKENSRKMRVTVQQNASEHLKNWLLQLPLSSKGYGLPFIHRSFMHDTGITMDIKQLECMIREYSNEFRLESPKNSFPLLYRNKEYPVPAAKHPVPTGGGNVQLSHCTAEQNRSAGEAIGAVKPICNANASKQGEAKTTLGAVKPICNANASKEGEAKTSLGAAKPICNANAKDPDSTSSKPEKLPPTLLACLSCLLLAGALWRWGFGF